MNGDLRRLSPRDLQLGPRRAWRVERRAQLLRGDAQRCRGVERGEELLVAVLVERETEGLERGGRRR